MRTQRWRHKEECLDTPIGDLPEYPEYQGRIVVHGLGAANAADRVPALARVLALMAEDWQASRSLLVVAARSPSLFHGGARLERKWRHKRKVRRLWNHVPEIVVPFVCGMSDAERRPGCGPSEDVVTFTQSTPKIVEGAATQEEIASAGQIVQMVNRARILDMMRALWLHLLAYLRMLCAWHTKACADRRCKRRPLPRKLCGPLIPVEFQARMRVYLMLGVISSISFAFGRKHRLVNIWACTMGSHQVVTAIGAPSKALYLDAPLKPPKVISEESPKAVAQVQATVRDGYIQTGVPRWQTLFASRLKTVPKVKEGMLNLNGVKGGGGENRFFRKGVVASSEFMKQYGFNSPVWEEQKFQMVNEMRAVFANKSLSVKDKASFGKLQVERGNAAYAEAHRQDETEERVVFTRLDLNESTEVGGKASVGAPGVLMHIPFWSMLEAMDAHKGYHQVSLSRVASALCGTKILAEDGSEQDGIWCVLAMGDSSSSNSHNELAVVPRLKINRVLDPTAECSVQLNATEFAYDRSKSSELGEGKGLWWCDIQGANSDDDESTGDGPNYVDGGYHSELPVGAVHFCSDGGLAVTSTGVVDDTLYAYPASHPTRKPYESYYEQAVADSNPSRPSAMVEEYEGDRRGHRVRMMSLYQRWTLNMITGAHDNDGKRTGASRHSVPFFGVSVHSEGWRQGVQYLNMPNAKKVKLLTRILEFMWARGVDMVALMKRHLPIESGAKVAVAMCLDADSTFGVQVRELISDHSMVSRREAMSLAGYIHHVGSIVSYIGRCTKNLYYDIYREGWGKGNLPSAEVDYDGDFLLSPTTVGELGLLIFLIHQPGQHMCLRRYKKLLYLSTQDASDHQWGGYIAMGRRMVVHNSRYAPNAQLLKSTPKEMLAMAEALEMASLEFERVRRDLKCSPEDARRWFQLILEGKGVVGAEEIPTIAAPASATVGRYEEFDASAICILGDNTASVGAGTKGVSSHPAMQRSADQMMVSCVKSDMDTIIYYLPGKDMEMNGTDNISRGKTEGTRLVSEIGLNTTANPIMNPFARHDWSLPASIREMIIERFGEGVKFFACDRGLTSEECANDVVVIYPTPSTALSLLDRACEVLDLCRYTMTLIMVCTKDCATSHMRSMLRRFDRQSNGQNSIILPPTGPGDVWSRYMAVKLPEKRPLITNQILYKYCKALESAEGNRAKMNEVLSVWLAKYGKAAVEAGSCEALSVVEALGDRVCDVSELNKALQEGVVPHEGPVGASSRMRMTAYRAHVTRSRLGIATAWGVISELRLSWKTKGYIVQLVTELWPPHGDGRVVVRKYTNAWRVFQSGSTMRIVASGKCPLVLTVNDLTKAGSRDFRLKAFFVSNADAGVEWTKKKGGVVWSPGHVLLPARGVQVLCRVLKAVWKVSGLPFFSGSAYLRAASGTLPTESMMLAPRTESRGGRMGLEATRSGSTKPSKSPNEPQGADLMLAAGLGQDTRFRRVLGAETKSRVKEISGSAVKEVHGDAVIGDLFGRKLTGARAARKNDAAVVCSECKQSVLLSEALACCFRAREVEFPKGTTGGQCGTVLCVHCFNDKIDEEQYPDWRDHPQRLLTHAHARMVYNFVCARCRYDICCGRTVVPRVDCQYLYLISLITQYMVDVYSHLAVNTTASYGQHLNVYLDFFDAAPELDRDNAMGAAAIDLVSLANRTTLGMLMLHRANEGLCFNGIRGLRSAVKKTWSMRNQESPTDQAEYVQFMKGLCERMGNEAGTKWAMPVAVMLALVSMATEDAITANKAGEADKEREMRTKAMYYLVCFLIWPRPGEQCMITLHQLARDIMYPQRAKRLGVEPHIRVLLDQPTKKSRGKSVDALIAWQTQGGIPVGEMLLQLFQIYEDTGVGLEVRFPHCGVQGKHFGPWTPWFALNMVLRPDLQRLKGDGMGLLSELAIDTEVVLRCFRTGGITHAGDRQVEFKFDSYLIDVHKRKGNMRGRQGKESTRETYDAQPTARRLVVTSRMA